MLGEEVGVEVDDLKMAVVGRAVLRLDGDIRIARVIEHAKKYVKLVQADGISLRGAGIAGDRRFCTLGKEVLEVVARSALV